MNGSTPMQGRVEVRHHGIWGTVCDDDFTNATATVICRSLGYGGIAVAKKDGYFGPGQGIIWLDEVLHLHYKFYFQLFVDFGHKNLLFQIFLLKDFF